MVCVKCGSVNTVDLSSMIEIEHIESGDKFMLGEMIGCYDCGHLDGSNFRK